MKVNMDDLLLAGLLDDHDELILLSQVCSAARAKRFGNASSNFVSACTYLTY